MMATSTSITPMQEPTTSHDIRDFEDKPAGTETGAEILTVDQTSVKSVAKPKYRLMEEIGVPPGYTRRLIRRRYMDPDEAAEDPELRDDAPESVWNRKLYGSKIKVVTTVGVPTGWVLVDRMYYL